jgi:hypothetical protein
MRQQRILALVALALLAGECRLVMQSCSWSASKLGSGSATSDTPACCCDLIGTCMAQLHANIFYKLIICPLLRTTPVLCGIQLQRNRWQ